MRVLPVGHGRKSDPDDAVSIAVAARSVPAVRRVKVEDQAVVLHLLTKRRVANMPVAVTQRIQQDGEWRDGDTSFPKVNVWRGQAEHLADSLKWATAKVERTSQRGNGDRGQGRERQAERSGDFKEPPPPF